MVQSGRGIIGMVSKRMHNKLDFTGFTPSGAAGPVLLCGTSSVPITTATADTKFLQIYVENTATSGDNRGIYVRQYLSGAGGGGEALRVFTTCNDVACGTAHGAHISLNFADTGSLTGLGVAMRATLHIANQAYTGLGGTYSAVQAEIYSDGSTSDPVGMTELSFVRVVNGGDTTGDDDVDTDAVLFSLQGFTAGTGNLVEAGTGMGTVTGTFKCKLGSGLVYIPYYSSAG